MEREAANRLLRYLVILAAKAVYRMLDDAAHSEKGWVTPRPRLEQQHIIITPAC